MKRILYLVFLGALGAWVLRAYAVEGIYIATGSMEPTLHVGLHVFVNKVVYRVRAPQRGEIVLFPSPVEQKELVKRVIAVGGDTLRIEKKQVILNGKPLEEPYVRHTRAGELLEGDDLDMGTVPPGHLVLLGDNRDESGDSRDWKDAQGKPRYFIPVSAVKGKVMGPA